jgi:hypothetical protein
MLAAILGGWILLRAAAWSVWPDPDRVGLGPPLAVHEHAAENLRAAAVARQSPSAPVRVGLAAKGAQTRLEPPLGQEPPDWQLAPSPMPLPPIEPRPAREVMPAIPPRMAGGHALLWLAAAAQLPGPLALLEQAGRGSAPGPQPSLSGGRSLPRWSADAWALVRGGSGAVGAAPFAPTYGGSQVGAALRYRLAPASGHRPTAYLRATAALAWGGEREVAVGLSLRPLPRLPVVVAGEARLGRIGGATVLRPAVVAVTEFAPVTLPAATRAEFYLQGGYVGGRGATAFVDGSARIDRHLARVGPVEVRAGAGLWGGAQEGAGRLDLGPSATLGLDRGRAAARLELDWRLRIAGEAAPASGPALTISAGF